MEDINLLIEKLQSLGPWGWLVAVAIILIRSFRGRVPDPKPTVEQVVNTAWQLPQSPAVEAGNPSTEADRLVAAWNDCKSRIDAKLKEHKHEAAKLEKLAATAPASASAQ
jgi:hypothetical protein